MITCANVTKSDLDLCCDHTTDCCNTGVGRMRLKEGSLDAITTIASSASTATRFTSTKTSHSSSTALSATDHSSSQTTPSSMPTPFGTSNTFSPAAASTPSPSGLTPKQSAAPSGVSTGAAVGIGIGSGCGAVGALAVFLLWRRRKRRSASALQEKSMNESPQVESLERSPEEMPGEWHPEMPVGDPVVEVSEAPGTHQHWELAAQSPNSGFKR